MSARGRVGAAYVGPVPLGQGHTLGDVMPEWVRTAVLRVPGVEHVDMTLTFDPPWTPERINDRVRHGRSFRESPSRRGLQGLGGAHDGIVGTHGLARWMDVAMTRWLGRRMKPITVT
jgi:metal-sulfur cluster biosynthetic enzyme